jgi:2-(1,2-epoxy-1,2-dihydrophenyl)acetyl-CoA isomerase
MIAGYKTIILSKRDQIITIMLNRPDKLNALSEEMLSEINTAIDEVAKDTKARVLIITAAGNVFSAGADLNHPIFSEASPDGKRSHLSTFHSIPLKLRRLSIPVIASVNGPAVGAGANIALACDIIIASEKARFGQVFANIGLHIDTGGTYFLPRSVGIPKAMELMMTGELLEASEAERIGMINRVVPHEDLEEVTAELARRLADGPPVALGMIKASVYENLSKCLEEALEHEVECQVALLGSPENIEGIKAFREKRRPKYSHGEG